MNILILLVKLIEKDFFQQFETKTEFEFRVCFFGIEKAILLIDARDSDEFLRDLNLYCKKFSTWRYFEDNDTALAKELSPIAKEIPFSRQAIEYFMQGELEIPAKLLMEDNSAKKSFWRDAPLREV